jgi:hypothetical protein
MLNNKIEIINVKNHLFASQVEIEKISPDIYSFDESRIEAASLCIDLAMSLLDDNRVNRTILNIELSAVKDAIKIVNQL